MDIVAREWWDFLYVYGYISHDFMCAFVCISFLYLILQMQDWEFCFAHAGVCIYMLYAWVCQCPKCVCSSLVGHKRAHGSLGNESLLALAGCWSKLQWQKTISGAAGLQSLTDLEDAGSTTLPLPTAYPLLATTV